MNYTYTCYDTGGSGGGGGDPLNNDDETGGNGTGGNGDGNGGNGNINTLPVDGDLPPCDHPNAYINESGECVVSSVEEQSPTRICSEYEFQQIGNAKYANIGNLHLSIYVQPNPLNGVEAQVIDIEFDLVCVSIPYAISHNASLIFNEGWENAKGKLFEELSSNPSLLNNQAAVKSALSSHLLNELNNIRPSSSMATQPCGGVPATDAVYCL
ncbi:hypothetical protein ACFQ1M_13645 [Sungkyunkwania multivorans]|uniref:Uncharacterized protein n=1 Tax=Sungkyunkwania multivorans TaxID=1173618 RepID=A0ABW3D2A2_9FLAO